MGVGIGVKKATDEDKTKIIGGSLATVRNSVGVTMFGGSGNFALNHPDVSSTILDFRNTTRIQLWQMVRRPEGGHEIKDGDWIQNIGADGKTIDTLSDDYNILFYNDRKAVTASPDTTTVTTTKPPATTTKPPETTTKPPDVTTCTGKFAQVRLKSSKAVIEFGPDGDVKLARSDDRTLMVQGNVQVDGDLHTTSLNVNDMDLDEYVQKLVKEILSDK